MKIIIPAAGLSSRYKNAKPKWLLTHPTGKLMIELVIHSLITRVPFAQFVVIILDDHVHKFEADLILRQIAQALDISLEIFVLPKLSKGPADTIYQYLSLTDADEPFLIKDADNVVLFNEDLINFSANTSGLLFGGDIGKHRISEVHQKSFISSDQYGRVSNFVEKKVVSNTVCFGLYGFSSTNLFKNLFDELIKSTYEGELFVSHLVQIALLRDLKFNYVEAEGLEDWGVWNQWLAVRSNHKTIFVDFDGVLVINSGKYGLNNWDSEFIPIHDNLKCIKLASEKGAQIVITTARSSNYRERIIEFLKAHDIVPHQVVLELNHSPRLLINDFADSNPYPSASALNIVRNSSLNQYDIGFV
jgi:hypothetical protein